MMIYNYLLIILPLIGIGVVAAITLNMPIDSSHKRKRMHPGE
jgi:hypothetical protein